MKKTNFLLLRIVAMVVMTVTVLTANAQEPFNVNGLWYHIISENPNKVKTNGVTGGAVGEIIIPETVINNNNNTEYTVTEIADEAFKDDDELTSVTIGNSVENIGERAFENCESLTSVTIGNSVTNIDYRAFANTGLTSVTIPNSVTTVGHRSFLGCEDLTSIKLSNSITSFDNYAFGDCLNLVLIISEIENIGGVAMGMDIFVNLDRSQCTLIVPKGKVADYQGASQWNQFANTVEKTEIGEEFIDNGVKYKVTSLEPKQAKVIANNYSGEITIPASVNYHQEGYNVTEIEDNAFNNCSGLTAVTIGNSVTNIPDNAFAYCAGLTAVTIGNSVTTIGTQAFEECQNLATVTIGSAVTNIMDYAFWNCTGLTAFNVDAENTTYSSADGVLFNKNQTTLMQYPKAKTNTDYVIPNSVETIERNAFRDNSYLTEVTIPNSVTNIGDGAFENTGLTSITSKIENIGGITMGAQVFQDVDKSNCTLIVPKGKVTDYQGTSPWNTFGTITEIVELNDEFTDNGIKYKVISRKPDQVEVIAKIPRYTGTNYDIPESVTKNTIDFSVIRIGYQAFATCSNLTSVTIPNSVDSIATYAFYECSGLTSIEIPNSVRGIGSVAFTRCTSLTSVTIPSSVQTIGVNAFRECNGLTYVRISGTTTGHSAFRELAKLDTLIIDNSVTTIGDGSFLSCEKLTSVTIPNSVDSIGNYAFYYCTGLTSVTSKIENIGNVTIGDEGVFREIDLSNTTLYVPKGKKAEYQGLSPWNRFGTITEIVEVGDQFTDNDIKYEVTSVSPKKVKVIANNYAGEINIPSSVTYNVGEYAVTEIGSSAFAGSDLTSITIPNSVTTIEASAFQDCDGLTSLTMGSAVTTIGENAFNSCDGLTSLTIGSAVETIGESAFYDCYNLNSITIPNSVTTIGESAFDNCSGLTSLTIGSAVTTIGNNAFASSFDLTSITSKIENIGSVTMGTNVFDGVDKTNCTLTVPKGKKAEYQGASQWSDFNTIVEEVNIGETFIVNNIKYEITSVTPKKVKVIAKDDPQYTGDITIPATVTNKDIEFAVTGVDENAFVGFTGVTSINVDAENTAYSSEAGVLFNKDKTTLVAYPAGKADTDYTISNSVTAIGNNAFAVCQNLTTITIGSAVANIGNNAFDQCTNLTSIISKIENIGNVTMGSNVFNGVSTTNCTIKAPRGKKADYQGASQWSAFTIIEDVNVGDTFTEANNVMYEVTSLEPNTVKVIYNEDERPSGDITIPATITYNGKDFTVTEIGVYAFGETESITSVTIPQSVTKIKESAFNMCMGLTAINVDNNNTAYSSENGILFNKDKTTLMVYPAQKTGTNYDMSNSVTKIVRQAFAGCQNLTSVTISSAVDTIGGYTFAIAGLTSVTIPNSVKMIGEGAFYECENLTTATIGNSVETIGGEAFYATGLTEIIIPNSVTTIKYSAFEDCGSLTSVTIGNSVETIGGSAFSGTGLTEIIIPNSVETIGGSAFKNCENLTSLTIGNSVTEIGEEAFAETGLTSITSKIENIGSVTMEDDVFYGVYKPNCTLTVPAGKKSAYQGAEQWRDFNNIVEETPTGITTVLSNPISVVGNNITISKVAGKNVKLYNLSGQVLYNLNATQDNITLSVKQRGAYIVQVGNGTRVIKL